MGLFDQEAPAFRPVAVQYGDTLRRIALRELGTAERWIELVLLNELRPPYIVGTQEERQLGVLVAGDMIKVPAPAAYADAQVTPDEVYGADLALQDGLLQVSGGDLALASGEDNLYAALLRRLTVVKRELAYHPEYGNFAPRLKGRGAKGAAVANLAAMYVRSALIDDQRVAAVPRCVGYIVADSVRVEASVVPITGRPLNLTTMVI